jgi:hypothetical protein
MGVRMRGREREKNIVFKQSLCNLSPSPSLSLSLSLALSISISLLFYSFVIYHCWNIRKDITENDEREQIHLRERLRERRRERS